MHPVQTHLTAPYFPLWNAQAKPLDAHIALLDQSCPIFQNVLLPPPPPPDSTRFLPLLSWIPEHSPCLSWDSLKSSKLVWGCNQPHISADAVRRNCRGQRDDRRWGTQIFVALNSGGKSSCPGLGLRQGSQKAGRFKACLGDMFRYVVDVAPLLPLLLPLLIFLPFLLLILTIFKVAVMAIAVLHP